MPAPDVFGHERPGLSSGAKTGIAVGILVISIAAMSIYVWLCWRCRKRKRTKSKMTTENPVSIRSSEDEHFRRQELAVAGHEIAIINRLVRYELQDREPTKLEGTSMPNRVAENDTESLEH